MKRVAIAWPGYTGYMGPCFKALSELCDLRVYVEPSAYEQQFDASSMAGVAFRRVDGTCASQVVEEVRSFSPDLSLICGWSTPVARALARARLPGRKVLDFDMPWEWTLRKLLARWVLWPYVRHFDAAFVPGNRCARYARWLGFRGKRLVLGSNPSGWERFALGGCQEGNERFLFVGRFSKAKGLDALLAAYAAYRERTVAPWPLDLVGSGEDLPEDLPEGVCRCGFVSPSDMPSVMREHACLVLPSRWEPWGVCAAEAMSAGLMTILSDRCGIVDDVCPTYVVRSGDVRGLAEALIRASETRVEERRTEGLRARSAQARYAAANWAQRVIGLCDERAMKMRGAVP